MGNFNATKVFYNNELITAKTRTGVKSMIFPKEIGSEHVLPLFPTFHGVPYTSANYRANMAPKVIEKSEE